MPRHFGDRPTAINLPHGRNSTRVRDTYSLRSPAASRSGAFLYYLFHGRARFALGTLPGVFWESAGMILKYFFPALNVSPVAFAIAGMGGVVGGSTAAACAIVMIFEMTLDNNDSPDDLDSRNQLCGAYEPDQAQHLYPEGNASGRIGTRNDAC
jgi:hypothetical protein